MPALREIAWIEVKPEKTLPPLDAALSGWEVHKRRPSHWNARLERDGATYFLKWFFHPRWSNPARREWLGAGRLSSLGIPTVHPVGWGRHPLGTFIVLEGAPGFPASECRPRGLSEQELDSLAVELARCVARLHDAGLCHRDLNVYHVLIDARSFRVIDVGRVTRFLRNRWVVKDLASLLYTARREGLSWRLARLFLRVYLASTRRRWRRGALIGAVQRKAERYRSHNEKGRRESTA